MGNLVDSMQKRFIPIPILCYEAKNRNLKCSISQTRQILNWEQNRREET
jgi:hypothetical protein